MLQRTPVFSRAGGLLCVLGAIFSLVTIGSRAAEVQVDRETARPLPVDSSIPTHNDLPSPDTVQKMPKAHEGVADTSTKPSLSSSQVPAARGGCDFECDWCFCGTEYENNCDILWFYDDECDCGCQWCDLACRDCFVQDCSDPCGPACDYCWFGTTSENNCPAEWCGDGDCDCGCQFTDADCPGGTCLCDPVCGNGNCEFICGEDCANCPADCDTNVCGDGCLTGTEACDDGPNNSDTEPDACRTDCSRAGCGDGVVDTGEECDDGNTEPGDGCDENCVLELGACCLGTACHIATETVCLDAGGTFFGFNTACDAPDDDGDGLRNECDGCPADANKIGPGTCGCGVDDSADSDDDGVPDCEDICPGADDAVFGDCTDTIPTVSVWGLLILALLLLAGTKVVFRNHSRRFPFP